MIHGDVTQHQLRKERPVCRRIQYLTCFMLLCFSAVAWKLTVIQVRKAPRLAEEAARKFQRHVVIPAQRGSIFDCEGDLLAYDERVYDLHTDGLHLKELPILRTLLSKATGVKVADLRQFFTEDELLDLYYEHVVRVLAPETGIPEDEVRETVRSGKPQVFLAREVREETAAQWVSVMKESHIFGVYLRPNVIRRYNSGNRVPLVVGYMTMPEGGTEPVPGCGLEKLADSHLVGTPGYRWIEHDRLGRELPLYRGEEVPAHHGKHVHMTIDLELQASIDAILDEACAIHAPKMAMAVVTDPKTGTVLSVSSWPRFLREDPGGDGNKVWRNHCFASHYQPGSTFKVITFAGAMDRGLVNENSRIDCEGGRIKWGPGPRDYLNDTHAMGVVPLLDVMVESSNVGTYKLGRLLGKDGIVDAAKRFGIGARTGFGLYGEVPGVLNETGWNASSLSSVPIGYEVCVTPLQMAMVYGAIANGGVLMRPRIIDRIVDPETLREERVMPKSVRQACTARTAEKISAMLEAVIRDGTAKNLFREDLRMAGKTGTVRHKPEGSVGYAEGVYDSTFVGFAPVDDPKVVCSVVFMAPKMPDGSVVTGSKVAGPVFSKMVATTLEWLSTRRDRPFKAQLVAKGEEQ